MATAHPPSTAQPGAPAQPVGTGAGSGAASALAAWVHERLRTTGGTVAVAESLTGGLLSAALSETPGASATMRGGLVVYASDLKAQLAGVDANLLASRGAVDPEVAAQLAGGARERLNASYGLGVTGVAGPEPQDGRPVGTVFAAVAGPAGVRVRQLGVTGDRHAIRSASVVGCLQLLADVLAVPAGLEGGPDQVERDGGDQPDGDGPWSSGESPA